MNTVLVVDNADAAFLFALAFRLKKYKIWLFAAESVEQAQSLREYIGAGLGLLIINCSVRGVCPFAATMARRMPGLQVLGSLPKVITAALQETFFRRIAGPPAPAG